MALKQKLDLIMSQETKEQGLADIESSRDEKERRLWLKGKQEVR